jgi:hypothetical protein
LSDTEAPRKPPRNPAAKGAPGSERVGASAEIERASRTAGDHHHEAGGELDRRLRDGVEHLRAEPQPGNAARDQPCDARPPDLRAQAIGDGHPGQERERQVGGHDERQRESEQQQQRGRHERVAEARHPTEERAQNTIAAPARSVIGAQVRVPRA